MNPLRKLCFLIFFCLETFPQRDFLYTRMESILPGQEVDMALGPFAVSYSRTKVVDFPATIFVLPHRVYLPRPRGTSDLSDFVRLYHPLVSWCGRTPPSTGWSLVFPPVGRSRYDSTLDSTLQKVTSYAFTNEVAYHPPPNGRSLSYATSTLEDHLYASTY